jgi:hypothetical protein
MQELFSVADTTKIELELQEIAEDRSLWRQRAEDNSSLLVSLRKQTEVSNLVFFEFNSSLFKRTLPT